MSICLCNLSADVALEALAKEGRELEPAETDTSAFVGDTKAVASALGDFADRLPRPLDVLLGSAKERRTSHDVACHVWQSSLPKGGVLRVHDGLYVTSPELTLLHQAFQLHQVNLCQMLGRYLGTWTPTDGGQEERAPLTTLESLDGFLKSIKGVRGLHNLRLAMAYTCEAAASAPETTLQLVMSLPPELHGFNLPFPVMNYKVNLSTLGQRLCDKESIRIDLCWPNIKYGLEYQGEEHGQTMGEDIGRWYAARSEGYELWYVAKEQLASSMQMDYIGREVARRLGVVVNEDLWPTQGQLQDLLDLLLGRTHAVPLRAGELRELKAAVNRRRRYRG